MNPPEHAEPRRYRRLMCHLPAALELQGGRRTMRLRGHVMNLSEGGALCYYQGPSASLGNARIALQLSLSETLELAADIRWTREVGTGRHYLGIEWSAGAIDARSRIVTWMQEAAEGSMAGG